jgi:hypothetical protein
MTNQSALSEKIGSHHLHDSSPTHKGSFDDEEGTIVRHSGRYDIKDGLHPAEAPPVQQPEVLEGEYPDGGLRAWLVVFGVSVL